MKTSMKSLLAIAAISLPGAAFAQPMSDAAYCGALVSKYDQYLNMSSRKGRQPQGVATSEAAAKCREGNPAGIPGLETALRDAGFSLPSRNVTAVSATKGKDANCGAETWSTEKMAYVGVPCGAATTDENPAGASR